jgi:hypothetical protein
MHLLRNHAETLWCTPKSLIVTDPDRLAVRLASMTRLPHLKQSAQPTVSHDSHFVPFPLPHRIELQTRPMKTAPSPTTAAPPRICDVDTPPGYMSFCTLRFFGRVVLGMAGYDGKEDWENDRDEEDNTNPICFKLSLALLVTLGQSPVDVPSDIESVNSLLNIALLTRWDSLQLEFG